MKSIFKNNQLLTLIVVIALTSIIARADDSNEDSLDWDYTVPLKSDPTRVFHVMVPPHFHSRSLWKVLIVLHGF